VARRTGLGILCHCELGRAEKAFCPERTKACPELAEALSEAEGEVEWVEGVAISLLRKLEMDTSASDRRIAST